MVDLIAAAQAAPASGMPMPSVAEHFDFVYQLLGWTTAALLAIVGGVVMYYRRRFDAYQTKVDDVLAVIPPKAIEQRQTLATRVDVESVKQAWEKSCKENRDGCTNLVVVKELDQSLKVIRQAVILLVMHSENIPEDDRTKIAQGLVK